VYSIGKSLDATLLEVKAGQSDFAGDGLPPASYAELWDQFGPTSKAGKSGKQQFFVNPTQAVRYFSMRTDKGPFTDVRLRKAVNYLIDRHLMSQQRGSYAGKVTDQILPPGMLGYKDVNAYPLSGTDVAKAKAVAGSAAQGKKVEISSADAGAPPRQAVIMQAALASIGIQAEVKTSPRATQIHRDGSRSEGLDMSIGGWHADYSDPFDFINVLLAGKSITDENSNNTSFFNDPKYNAAMEKAARTTGDARGAAYASLDADLTKNAPPWATFINDNDRNFFSGRVGCQKYQPVYEYNLGALCLR